MKKVKTEWEKTIDYNCNFNCPHCNCYIDDFDLIENGINEGSDYRGQFICNKCSKIFELEIES